MYIEISERSTGKTTRLINDMKFRLDSREPCIFITQKMSWGKDILRRFDLKEKNYQNLQIISTESNPAGLSGNFYLDEIDFLNLEKSSYLYFYIGLLSDDSQNVRMSSTKERTRTLENFSHILKNDSYQGDFLSYAIYKNGMKYLTYDKAIKDVVHKNILKEVVIF